MTDKTYGPDKLTIKQMHSNRADGKAAGHSHYFTGKACKHGHIVPRRTTSNQCLKCENICYKARYIPTPRKIISKKMTKEERAEKRSQYWKDNKERLSEKNKDYYEANKDTAAKRDKLYYENNRQKIRDRKKEYYLKNQEKLKKYQRDYRKSVKEEKAMIDDGDFL